ncbi:hypothetical protein MRX96_057616 [Rhipicephalus microplus]
MPVLQKHPPVSAHVDNSHLCKCKGGVGDEARRKASPGNRPEKSRAIVDFSGEKKGCLWKKKQKRAGRGEYRRNSALAVTSRFCGSLYCNSATRARVTEGKCAEAKPALRQCVRVVAARKGKPHSMGIGGEEK